jgi:hypothetical protein
MAPSTATLPFFIMSSDLRREPTPERAKIFWRRSSMSRDGKTGQGKVENRTTQRIIDKIGWHGGKYSAYVLKLP